MTELTKELLNWLEYCMLKVEQIIHSYDQLLKMKRQMQYYKEL
mgnify:CR=1 FL=1